VWVFDQTNPAPNDELGGRPLEIVTTFSDKLRALATSPDGNTVYAAAFYSGNRTTVLNDGVMCDRDHATDPVHTPCVTEAGETPAGSMLPPFENADGVPAPNVGLSRRPAGHRSQQQPGRGTQSPELAGVSVRPVVPQPAVR
jgi:hypothetical protein